MKPAKLGMPKWNGRRWIRSRVAQALGVQGDLQMCWTPELPIIYVSNAKCGCSTIKNSLKHAQADSYAKNGIRGFRRETDPHVSDDCLRSRGLPIDSCGARYVISGVRNPFARALSGYLDMIEGRRLGAYPELRWKSSTSFEDHLHALSSRAPRMLNVHFRPQHLNIGAPHIPYDAIFFLENIAAMTAVLARPLGGFSLQTYAPHARSASSRLMSYYSQRAVELVQQIYARDFQVFNYSTEISEASSAPGAYVGLRGVADDGADPLNEPAAGVSALIPTVRFQRLIEMRLL
jgi:hypothetical protein